MSSMSDSLYTQSSGVLGAVIASSRLTVEAAKGLVKFFQYLLNKLDAGKLTKNQFENYIDFTKTTGGDFRFCQVPILEGRSAEEQIAEIREELKKRNIRFCENAGDHTPNEASFCIYSPDMKSYDEFLRRRIHAFRVDPSEKTLADLKSMYQDSVTYISLPTTLASSFKDAAKATGIPYVSLPDLNVNDQFEPFAIPLSDAETAKQILEIQKTQLLASRPDLKGSVPDATFIHGAEGEAAYLNSGKKTIEEYVNDHAAEMKAARPVNNEPLSEDAQKFQDAVVNAEPSTGTFEFFKKATAEGEYTQVRFDSDAMFSDLKRDGNKVLHESFTSNPDAYIPGHVYFRVPGTWGENTEAVAIPLHRLFRYEYVNDNGEKKTSLTGFLKNDEKLLVFSPDPSAKTGIRNVAERYDSPKEFQATRYNEAIEDKAAVWVPQAMSEDVVKDLQEAGFTDLFTSADISADTVEQVSEAVPETIEETVTEVTEEVIPVKA